MRFRVKLIDYLAELINQISISPNGNHQLVLLLSQRPSKCGEKSCLQSRRPQSQGSLDDPVSAIGKGRAAQLNWISHA
jgi:hypothetical protein